MKKGREPWPPAHQLCWTVLLAMTDATQRFAPSAIAIYKREGGALLELKTVFSSVESKDAA